MIRTLDWLSQVLFQGLALLWGLAILGGLCTWLVYPAGTLRGSQKWRLYMCSFGVLALAMLFVGCASLAAQKYIQGRVLASVLLVINLAIWFGYCVFQKAYASAARVLFQACHVQIGKRFLYRFLLAYFLASGVGLVLHSFVPSAEILRNVPLIIAPLVMLVLSGFVGSRQA